MKSREISRSKIEPFSLACTDPYIGKGRLPIDILYTLWTSALSMIEALPAYAMANQSE